MEKDTVLRNRCTVDKIDFKSIYEYECDDVILLLKKLSQILMFIFSTVHTKLEGIELEN